ncbi:MAG: ABC transporter substrate-binding protein [Bacilli bacterium]|nr:ABC transporter substrate-binding protein [Bacilli bacterium]
MKIKKLSLLLILSLLPFTSCNKKENKLVLAEVTHSLFYAPLYIAQNKGYFDDEGLEVEIITTPGADKVMASLLSSSADIGLMGPEASIYIYEEGQKNYAINFAQLTQKDGSFLLGREKDSSFTYDKLKGKTIIGGRLGGMPEMTLEYLLKSKGLTITRNNKDKEADVNIRTDVSFDVMTGVFTAGESDYVTAFEPNASQIQELGKGYIVASIGQDAPSLPYTAFSSLKSTLNKNKEKLIKFTRAIKKSLDLVNKENSETLSSYLSSSFPSSSIKEIISVLDNYKKIEAWPTSLNLSSSSFASLEKIMKEANQLPSSYTSCYEQVVTDKIVSLV